MSGTLEQVALQGFPLSPQQRRLWSLGGDPEGTPYRAACAVLLEGALDRRRLRDALERVVERHEVLRTTFRCLPGMTVPLQVVGEGRIAWQEEGIMAALERPWDLAEEPPLRAVLLPDGPDRHRLLLALPALCADARSLANLAQEIVTAYAGELAEEPMQYADVAAWQNEVLDAEETEGERDFWRQQEAPPLLAEPLPFERAAEAGFAPRVAAAGLDLGPGLEGTSPEVFLLACWQLLMGRLSGRGELVVCVRSEGRDFAELAAVVGPLEKLLPVVLRWEEGERFAQIVRRAGRALEQARAHQNAFAWDRLTPDSTLAPALAFEMEAPLPKGSAGGLRWTLQRAGAVTERFALKLSCAAEPGGSLSGTLHYDASRFLEEDVHRLAGWLTALTHHAEAAPESAAGELELLTGKERRRELVEHNATRVDLPRRLLHELVREQAARTPGKVAVRSETGTLTFAELMERTGQLAGRLRAVGVGLEVPVAIHAERSPEMVVALLAVLEAGGIWVPLDPDHPAERLAGILQDVEPVAVLTQRHLTGSLPRHGGAVVLLETPHPLTPSPTPSLQPGEGIEDDRLAYVIYTSGSTGRPKGVMVSHRAIVNRLLWMQRELPLAPDDRVLQKTPYGFDASIWEIFCPLLAGAELVLARPGGHQDSAYLAGVVADQRITVLQLVPSLLRPFLDEQDAAECRSLRRMLCGGEELPASLARRFSSLLPDAVLHNLYGPTETAIDATFHVCGEPPAGRSVPIGRPIANLEVYLLSPRGMPVPAGVAGELFIGGTGLARGYWRRAEQTAERFVPHPFSQEPGARLYRTGDLARRRPDGAIEYLGRADRQVKVRGVRIEPREIEAVLTDHPEVRQAVVLPVPEEDGGGMRLAAFVVPEIETAGLRRFLGERLPAAMMPAVLVPLRALPLNPNGKLDTRALAEAAREASEAGRQSGYVAPRTPIEQVLAEVWAEILGAERVGLLDDFFGLGGHSLRATQLVSRVRRVFQVELPVRDLFERPTVEALAAHLDRLLAGGEAVAAPPIVPVPRTGRLPLSFAQQRLWFLDRLQPGSALYNLPTAVRFTGALDVAALERSLGEIVRRHEALRTTFHEGDDGEPVQEIGPPVPVPLPVVDLTGLAGPGRAEAESGRVVAAEVARPFRLATGPLLRALLVRLDAASHVGVLTTHHIVSDGWSTTVLVREMAALYRSLAAGESPRLPELPLQYADFAVWQRSWLQGEVLERQIGWWRERLAGAPPVLELPGDRPRPAVQTFRGASEVRVMAAGVGEGLHAQARRQGATLFMVLVAAGQVLLRWWTGQQDVVVGTDVANRNRDETEGLIGFFINQLALRGRLGGDPAFGEVVAQAREVTLGAYAHQDLPFDRLVLALNPERSRKHAPLFQVKVNLHNLPPPEMELPGVQLQGVQLARDTAQLDLILNFLDTPRALVASADYSADLFDGRTIARLLGDLETLLEAVAGRPEARLSELDEVLERADREQRLAVQEERRQARSAGDGPARPRTIQGFQLSAQQAHLWRLMGRDGSPYHARCKVRIEGELDEAALRDALGDVVERHEILRTRFELLPGMSVPLQVIGEAAVWTATLRRLSPGESLLLLELPPLCADSSSLALLAGEIARAYAVRLGSDEPLPEVPMQYADFAAWQHELLESEDGREEAAGWTAAGLAAAGAPALPWSPEMAEGASFAPESHPLDLPAGALAPGPGFLLACWAALLARLTGESRVALGVAREGRGYDELAGAIGLFTRYLPVVLETPPALRLDRLTVRAAEAVEEAEARQDGFSWEGRQEGDSAPFPVHAFEYEAGPRPVTVAGVRFSLAERSVRGERFVSLLAVSGTQAELRYDAGRLRPEDARRLGRCLETLAASAVARPEDRLGDLDVLAPEERRRVLFDLNDTAVELGAGLLHGPFLRQVAATPGRVAVRFEGGTLTYAELAERSAALARRLRGLGVGPETPVALCVERSPEMVVGLLGILRAGGAYVPLDPEHPEERRAAILAEVRPPVVLTDSRLTELLAAESPAAAPDAAAGPGHLAYVIYTSGSTGRPKGVMVTHGAIANRLLWMRREHPLGEDDRVLQKTPYGFDASIWEIFLPLSVGAELVLARPGGHQDMAYLAAAVAEQGITVLQLVPSLLRPFLDEPAAAACAGRRGLRRVFCGGEELPADLARRFQEVLAGSGAELCNLYGPTEAAIDATSWPCRQGLGRRSVPIGKPIANLRVYVTGAGLHALPAGVPGELCIGGAGLARGYLGRPDQTAERFVPDPFSGEPGGRLYRTGDRARHRPGGELEYLGRLDRQVKIRGVRIEPREIEALLREHPEVRDAVVAIRGEGDHRRLVAWVVPAERREPDPRVLRDFLRQRLPDAMVPAAFACLPSLPLTPNGKLDLAALPDPAGPRPAQGPVPPRTETEAVLAGLWAEVLGVPRVGVYDNFFELGGHSLSATQVISRVRKGLGVDLAVHQLFDAPTVAGLAVELEVALRGGGEESRLPPVEPAPRQDDMPLSFAQQRLWFFERLKPGTPVFNILVALRLHGTLDVTALSRALDEVVRRHESLRTTFPDRRGLPVQVVGEPRPVPLPVVDLQALPETARQAEVKRRVAAEGEQPFDLARGPLLRVLLLRLTPEEHVVPFTVHHIVSDAWSSGVLTREIAVLYRAFSGGEPPPESALPPLPVQYADFAAWQQRWLAGEVLEAQTAWWTRRLAGAPPLLALPTDRPRPRELSFRGSTLPVAFSEELTGALQALGRRHGVTLFMTVLAAFQLLLRRLSGQHDIVVGTDVANRNRLETEGLIGFFINQLVLRTDVSGDPTFAELLARVREVTLGAYAHQDTPFEQLVEALQLPRTLAHAPLFQVKFFLENTPAAALDLPGLTLEPLAVDSGVAKLDLTLALWQGRGLTGWINYSTDLFDGRRIERLTGHLEAILEAAAARPEARLSELEEGVAERERREREEDKRALQQFSLGRLRAVAPKAPATARPKINDGEV